MPEQLTLNVDGMTCGGCERSVERVVSALPGVSQVRASFSDRRVIVTHDPALATWQAIAVAIKDAGYEVASAA